MRRVSDMLRTLWKNVKSFAHKNVRFLPTTIIIAAILFIIPLSVYDHQATINIASASFWDNFNPVNWLEWIFKAICWLIFILTGFVFAISGDIFNLSMTFSLSGSLFKSFTFINSSWIIIRDLVNSLFIFAILFVAIKQLLSFGDFDSKAVKKTLTGIIAAALLINFSLFFTKVAIDISNVTSRAIFYTMKSQPGGTGEVSYGPANALAYGLNIQEILSGDKEDEGEGSSNLQKGLVYLGGSAIHIVGAISFFVMAFYFIVRIAILIILMITSPLFFISFVFNNKQTSGLKAKWLGTLTGQLVFPVVYLALIFIVVNIVNSGLLSGKNVPGSFENGMKGGASGFAIVINFMIVIILMVMAFKTAKDSAGMAGKFGGKLAGASAGAAFAGMAFAGRNLGGRAAGYITRAGAKEGTGLNKWVTSESKYKRMVGDKVMKMGKAGYEGTWDVRNAKAITTPYGMANAQLATGVTPGKGTTLTAKANLREFGELTAEGKKKEAAYQTAKIKKYDNTEAKVNDAQSRLGKNINEKEYKDFREELIKEIREKNKDKPAEQERLIKKLVGEETYRTKSDYSEVRTEIRIKTSEKKVKDTVKEAGQVRKNLEAKNKAIQDKTNEISKASDPAVIKTLTDQKVALETEKKGLEDKLEGHKKDFAEHTKIAPAKVIGELDAKEVVGTFRDQLSAAHMKVLSDKLSKYEYNEDDEAALNKMVNEMRYDPKTKREISNWINNAAAKGIQGFQLELQNDIIKALESIPAGGTMDPAVKADIENKIRQITDRELENLTVAQITHKDILEQISPAQIKRYAEKIHRGNNTTEKDYLENVADEIHTGARRLTIKPHLVEPYAFAFRGQNPPGKKGKGKGKGGNTP